MQKIFYALWFTSQASIASFLHVLMTWKLKSTMIQEVRKAVKLVQNVALMKYSILQQFLDNQFFISQIVRTSRKLAIEPWIINHPIVRLSL